MPYNPQPAPAHLDSDGVRKYVEDEFLEISRAWEETVSKFGDTIDGNLTVTGKLEAGAGIGFLAGDVAAGRVSAPTTGAYYFGNTGTTYLYYDGTNYNLTGGPLAVASSIYSALSSTTGQYQFGNTGAKYLGYDGLNYSLVGGDLYTLQIIAAGSIWARSSATTGAFQFGSSGAVYLYYDGSRFNMVGGVLFGIGYAGRQGTTGGSAGNTFNTWWTGAANEQWIDTVYTGTINVTSDYRIKKDVKDVGSMLDEVRRWRPITYTGADWKIFKKNNKERHSFIAHELQTVSPDCVVGEKDGEHPQSLDLVPIVARLTKAVQELLEKVEKLEAKKSDS